MRWLTLLVGLPATPTRHRVGVWRKLQRMGAVRLRGSAWILPETAETKELFEWLVQEVQSVRGEATLLRVDRIETMREEQVTALFHTARAAEYEEVVRGSREVLAQLDRAKSAHRASFAQVRAKLEGLKRELDRIESIDHLESPAGRRAREVLGAHRPAADGRGGPADRPYRTPPRLHPARAGEYVGDAATTPHRPDRIRMAHQAVLRCTGKVPFADAADAPKKGVPFDVLGAEFGHHGEDCTFETLVKRFGVNDRRLRVIAEIVHEADLHDGKFTRTEARGVDLAIKGLAESTGDDHELLERGMAIFDGLYTVLKRKT